MSKCLSTTFLIFLISYFQTAYESVLFRVVLADSLIMIPLPFRIVNSFLIKHFIVFIAAYKAHPSTSYHSMYDTVPECEDTI